VVVTTAKDSLRNTDFQKELKVTLKNPTATILVDSELTSRVKILGESTLGQNMFVTPTITSK
jgi:hypothetical protein